MDSDLPFSEITADCDRKGENDEISPNSTFVDFATPVETENLSHFTHPTDDVRSEKNPSPPYNQKSKTADKAPRPLSQFILEKRDAGRTDVAAHGEAELVIRSDKDGSSILTGNVSSFAVTATVPVPLKPFGADGRSIGTGAGETNVKSSSNRVLFPLHAAGERIEYPLYDADDILPFPETTESAATENRVLETGQSDNSPPVPDKNSDEIQSERKRNRPFERMGESRPRIVCVAASADEELLLPLHCDLPRQDVPILFRRYLTLLRRNR